MALLIQISYSDYKIKYFTVEPEKETNLKGSCCSARSVWLPQNFSSKPSSRTSTPTHMLGMKLYCESVISVEEKRSV